MPQRRSKPEPEMMTRGKAAPVLIAAGVVDLLRLFFSFFWFFGPAMVGAYCAYKVGDVWVIGGLLASGCAAGATALGIAGTPVIGAFGVVMAMAVGLFGFLAIGLWIVMKNRRILKTVESAPLQFGGAFAVGEIPFIGALPVFTVILWKLYATQIKVEKAAHKKWEEEQAAAIAEKRQQQQMANDEFYAQQAANKEIPDEVREAA